MIAPVKERAALLIVAAALLALPFLIQAIGLGVTSATEVVVFAIACMALNVLVGYTGLVSFGHGAWFGLGAYAAGILQREVLPGHFWIPLAFAGVMVGVIAAAFGALILRRRGVAVVGRVVKLVKELEIALVEWRLVRWLGRRGGRRRGSGRR